MKGGKLFDRFNWNKSGTPGNRGGLNIFSNKTYEKAFFSSRLIRSIKGHAWNTPLRNYITLGVGVGGRGYMVVIFGAI